MYGRYDMTPSASYLQTIWYGGLRDKNTLDKRQ